MSIQDSRIDDYIARQADFARPILNHLRGAIHAACPQIEETLKWGMPAFMYKSEILATMAAFKQHATFGFWRGSQVVGDGQEKLDAMGQFGRLRSVTDLPDPQTLRSLIEKAMELAGSGVKLVRAKTAKGDAAMPEDLKIAIDANEAAATTFAAFPPSCRREYADWVRDAKRPETRARRIAQAVAWMAEGKRRNWKYEKC